RRKSPCFSRTATSTPDRASSSPRTIPAGPPPTTQHLVRSAIAPPFFTSRIALAAAAAPAAVGSRFRAWPWGLSFAGKIAGQSLQIVLPGLLVCQTEAPPGSSPRPTTLKSPCGIRAGCPQRPASGRKPVGECKQWRLANLNDVTDLLATVRGH